MSVSLVSTIPPVDLAVTYDALRTNHVTAATFWMQGGAVELQARFYHGLGRMVIDADPPDTNTVLGVKLATAPAGRPVTVKLTRPA